MPVLKEKEKVLVRSCPIGVRTSFKIRRHLRQLADDIEAASIEFLKVLVTHKDQIAAKHIRTDDKGKSIVSSTRRIYSDIRMYRQTILDHLPANLKEAALQHVAGDVRGYLKACQRWEWQVKTETEQGHPLAGRRMNGLPAWPTGSRKQPLSNRAHLVHDILSRDNVNGHKRGKYTWLLRKTTLGAKSREKPRKLNFIQTKFARIYYNPKKDQYALAIQVGGDTKPPVGGEWLLHQKSDKSAGPLTPRMRGWIVLPLVTKYSRKGKTKVHDYAYKLLASKQPYGSVQLVETPTGRWEARIAFKWPDPGDQSDPDKKVAVFLDVYPYVTAALVAYGDVQEVRRFPSVEHIIPHERWVSRARAAAIAGRRLPSAPDERPIAHAASDAIVAFAAEHRAQIVMHDPGKWKSYMLKARKSHGGPGLTKEAKNAIRAGNRIISAWDYGRLSFYTDYKARLAGLGTVKRKTFWVYDVCTGCHKRVRRKDLDTVHWKAYQQARKAGQFECPHCGHRGPYADIAVCELARRITPKTREGRGV